MCCDRLVFCAPHSPKLQDAGFLKRENQNLLQSNLWHLSLNYKTVSCLQMFQYAFDRIHHMKSIRAQCVVAIKDNIS